MSDNKSGPRTVIEPPSPTHLPATIQPPVMNGHNQSSSSSTSSGGSNAQNSPDSSLPPTPGEKDGEWINFTPKRAMASFENLVVLANHQERLKEARKMVWRDKGQPVVEMDTLEECLKHALSGGLRSASLAFNIRACVNIVLALLRIHKVPRKHRFALIRHAIFGFDTFRFAAMLGTFTSLYKFLINALPIIIPSISPPYTQGSKGSSAVDDSSEIDLEAASSQYLQVPGGQSTEKRRGRLSLTKRAQIVLIRKQTRRWHAALAGAVAGGLAIIWENRSRRGVIGQQMFVRGLQGSYNAFTTKRGWHVPHGDVLVFALACGQIMYGFLMRPDTLPRSYNTWIATASKVPQEVVAINKDLVRTGTFNVDDLDKIVRRADITAANKADLLAIRNHYFSPSSVASAANSAYEYFPTYGPCSGVHPALSNCSSVPLDRFLAVFKWMLPIYGALHFVPAVLFKRKTFMEDPVKMLIKAGLGSMRSSAFLGVFVVIYQTIFCYKHQLHRLLTVLRNTPSAKIPLLLAPLARIPAWITNLLVGKASFWILGLLSGLSLFVEEKRRRGELAMYVLPKGLESLWVALRGKGYVFRTGKWGEVILTSLGMGMVMASFYLHVFR
ncbi:hypothetical protein CVT24_011869 [Panaeolus cyanescens]|uniref:Transmembrane protein 135 N-terminal domain-containing protein n=1 Tax=Panaeolus cyanescens TaxID=181874 RepID=A0A409YNK8_9AGAR|nr:hypothetical protein CVT24_011869 [Panaeolus cyanescens]